MCLYPKLIKNRRYVPNKKNGGIPPQCPDERLRYITAACGKCMECRQQKQRQKLNSEQINYLKGQIAIGWANVAIGEKSVANESDRIANELMIGIRDLDRKDRELIKDWIYEGIHAGKEISGEILNWLMRGAPKQ